LVLCSNLHGFIDSLSNLHGFIDSLCPLSWIGTL